MFNVSSPAGFIWVTVGFIGQLLFTGRMVVQWLVSTKAQRSVVPPIFWWMSLVGATMLLVYFAWRRDPIGILGQAVGWTIYIHNLWLIYTKPAERVDVTEDPGPEPEIET
ncbi:MAG: lipid-A-disaccharide synthase N-terminal domain-containing protein [Planctomycetes bacterium]|nr:lipid-A-disaccharide synthase N-terminal domain-containing protein [Planctomycetota bacterium]